MKKIYLLLSVLLLSSMAWADGPIFHEDFTDQAAFDAWTQKDTPWQWFAGNQVIQGTSGSTPVAAILAGSETTGSVLISPAFNLPEGKTYTISFWARRGSGATLELYAGKDLGTLTEAANKLEYNPAVGTTAITGCIVNITVSAGQGGNYYLGFKAITTDPYVFIDNINVEEAAPCTITNLPWEEHFDGTTPLSACWKIVDVNGDAKTWARPSGYLRYTYSTPNDADDWVFTPKFQFSGTKTYKIKFKAAQGGSYQEKLALYISPEQSPASATANAANKLWYQEGLAATATTQPAASIEQIITGYDGEYTFGFYVYSNKNMNTCTIDDIVVEEILDYDAGITAVTVEKGLAAQNRGLETVSVTIKNFGSQTISTFQLKLEVDDVVTTENYTGSAITGGAESASYALTNQADLSADGDHTIKVTVILPNDGLAANDALEITVKNTICTPVVTFPWSEGFEGLGVNQLPSGCWSATNLGSKIFINPASPYNGSAPHTGSGYAYFQFSSNDSITTQSFAFTGGQVYKFSFWYATDVPYGHNTSGHDLYASLYKASDNSFVQKIGTPVTTVTKDYQEYAGLFTPETADDYYIVVKGKITGSPWYVSIDDLDVREFAAVPDAGVTAITAPVSGIDLSQQAVTVTVKNYGGVALPATTPVAYTLNGGAETVQTIGSEIAVGGASLPVTFTVLADGFVEGDNVIKAYTKLEGDVDLTNDTTIIHVNNTVCTPVSSFPWSEGFEDLGVNELPSLCWSATRLGSKIVINPATPYWNSKPHTGSGYAYFQYSSNDSITTRSFAFTGGQVYKFSFWYVAQIASPGHELYASLHKASDDSFVQIIGTPVTSVTEEYQEYSGLFAPEATGDYYIVLTAKVAYDPTYQVSIDDLRVGEFAAVPDAGVTAITAPVSGANLSQQAVTVTVRNQGGVALPETTPVAYTLNGGAEVVQPIGSEIAVGGSLPVTFTTLADGFVEGDNIIKAYTKLDGDVDLTNDTTSIVIKNYICLISTFPFTEDFETAVAGESLSPCWKDNYHNPQITNHTPDGQWGWRFNANGNFYLISPELSATATSKVITYWMWAYTDAPWTVGYSTTDNEVASFTTQVETSTFPGGTAGWREYSFVIPGDAKYVIFQNTGEYTLFLDDLTIDLEQGVVSSTPEANATAVAPSQAITLTFAKDIVVSDYTLITLKAGETAVDAEANEAGKVLTITPAAALAYNTTYTVTVPAAAISGLSQAYTLTFTTADVPPVIAEDGFIPANGATNVAVGSQVGVTFNKAITLGDISGITINGSTDLITAVARALSNTQLRINHAALAQGTEYTVVIPAGAVVGYDQEITWSFTTIAALVADVNPADGATNVAIDAPLVVEFNRATLAPRGISFAALTIKADGSDESIADITTDWNATRDMITISHPALEYNTHYTVNIPRGLIIEANDYTSDITWSFTTESELLVGAWLETFESRTNLPAAWTTTLGGIFGDTKYWNLAALYSRYTAEGAPALFDDHFVWFNGYTNPKNFAANLITPQFTPTAADHTLTYDVAEALIAELPGDRNAGLQLYVEVSTDGGVNYIESTDNVLLRYPNHNSETAPNPAAVPYNYTLDLAAYVDLAINVRFRAVSDLGAYVVALDNVGVKTTEVITGTVVSPEEGAEGVELDEPIIVVFDKSVNTNGAADFSNAVLIDEQENEIATVAEISEDGTEVVFTHVDLNYASGYVILIPAASVVGLAEDIVSGFSTKLSPLTIEGKTPAAGATDVELDAPIAVTFSRAISLNTVPGVKATVKDADGVAVEGVSLTANGAVLTVNHADLAPATVYTVNIIDVAIAGWFEAITWSFTTKIDVGIHAPQSSVSVYPTLSKGNITVAAPADAKITIVDVLGNALATYKSIGQTPISLNYANGIYVVVVENENTVSTHKVILKK